MKSNKKSFNIYFLSNLSIKKIILINDSIATRAPYYYLKRGGGHLAIQHKNLSLPPTFFVQA